MKTLTIALLTMITLANTNLVKAADTNQITLNPMVQIELRASIKADWVLAERLMTLDIEDDLADQENFPKISNEFISPVSVASRNRLALNTAVFTNTYITASAE